MIDAVCLSHLTGDLSHSEVIYCLSGVITAAGRAGMWRDARVACSNPLTQTSPALCAPSDFYRCEMELLREASCRQRLWDELVAAIQSQDAISAVLAKLDLLLRSTEAELNLTESGCHQYGCYSKIRLF